MKKRISGNPCPKGWISLLTLLYVTVSFSQQGPVQPMVQVPSSPIASSLGKYAEYPVSLNTGTVNISIPLYTIQSKSLQLPISLSYHSSGIKVNDRATNVGLGWSLNAGGVVNRAMNGTPDEYGHFGMVAQADTLEYFGNAQKLLNDPNWGYTGPNPARIAHVQSFKVDNNFLDAGELASKQYLDNIIRFKTEDAEPDRFSYNFNGRSGFFMYDNNNQIYTSDRAPVKVDLDIHRQTGNDRIEITAEDGTLYRFGKDSSGNEAFEETVTNTNPVPNNSSYANIDYVSSWYLSEIISANKLDTISLKYVSFTELETIKSQQFSITDDKELMSGGSPPLNTIDCTDIQNNNVSISRHTKYLDEIYFKNGKVTFNHAQDRDDADGEYRLESLDVYHLENGNYTKIEQIVLDNDHYFQRDNSSLHALNGTFSSAQLKSLKLEKVLFKDGSGNEKGNYSFTYNGTDLPPRNCFAQDYWGYYNGEKQNTSLIPQATYANCPVYFAQGGQVVQDASESHMKASVLEEIQYPTGGKVKFGYESHYIKTTTNQQNITTYTEDATAFGTNPTLPAIVHTPLSETQFTYQGGFTDTRITYEVSGYSRNLGYTANNYVKLIDVTANNSVVFFLEHLGPNEPGGANNTKSGSTNVALTAGHTYKVQAYVGDSSLKPGGTSIFGTSYANVSVRWDDVTNTQNIVSIPVGGLRVKTIKYFEDGTQSTPSFMKRYAYGTESYQGHGIGRQLYDHTNNVSRSISFFYDHSSTGNFYDYSIYHSSPVDIQTNNGSNVEYDQVTEYYSDSDEFKAIYDYHPSNAVFSGLPVRNSPYGSVPRLSYPAWEQGILKSKRVYSFDNGNYTLVSQENHGYVDLGTKTVHALKAQTLSKNSNEETLGIIAFNYDILLGKKALSSTTSTTYAPNGDLIASTQTQYDYEPDFFLQESITNSSSKSGETFKTSYIYPHTIAGQSAVETSLENAHRLLPPLETSSYKVVGVTEELLSKQKIMYRDWGFNGAGTANIISPEKIQSLKGGGTSSQMIDDAIFHGYDGNGNPTESSLADGSHSYYIWGYNGSFPIAKVDNLESSQITTALQNLIDTAVSTSNADNDRTYGTNGLEGALRTALGNVRSHSSLSSALITTYTYDPLIGVTSVTDPSGQTVYYQYDNFNRLKEIRDEDNNLVTDYQYHYEGQ